MGVRAYAVKHYEMEFGDMLSCGFDELEQKLDEMDIDFSGCGFEGHIEICTQSIEECEYDNELINMLKEYAKLPYAQKTGFVRIEFI